LEVIVTLYSTLLLAAFFFLIGAAVMGIIWYLQSVASGSIRKGKKTDQTDQNLAEVARLMRDKENQDLVVTMNGHTFHKASELNPGQSRRLHFASKVLAKWLAEAPPPPPEEEIGGASTTSANADTLAASADEEWIPAESAPVQSKHAAVPPFIEDQTSQVKPVSTQFTDVVSGILKPASTQTTEFKSIAMQIDEILQEMIANTPFEKRGISVNDAPDHGVMVTLDGKEYPGVKDVPDEEVRGLIRSAVVEWEKGGKYNEH
jgi:hypothetical protein